MYGGGTVWQLFTAAAPASTRHVLGHFESTTESGGRFHWNINNPTPDSQQRNVKTQKTRQ